MRQLAQPLHLRRRQSGHRGQIHLATLDRDGARGTVRDHAQDELVQIGLAVLPVVLVTLEDDVAPTVPLLKFEGPGADRLLHDLGLANPLLGDLLVAERVARQHRGFAGLKGADQVGLGCREVEDDGVVVRRLDLLDIAEIGATARMVALRDDVDRELHVLAGEGLAVVPEHVRAEPEGVGQLVVRDLPGLGETRHRSHAGTLVFEQALVNLGRDQRRRHRRGGDRRKGRRLRVVGVGQGATASGLVRQGGDGCPGEQGCHGETEETCACHDGRPPLCVLLIAVLVCTTIDGALPLRACSARQPCCTTRR